MNRAALAVTAKTLTLATPMLMSFASRAELWTAENRIESRLEANDNYLLAPKSNGTVKTASFSDTLHASRQTESSATRLGGTLTALYSRGPGGESRVDGRLDASHVLKTPTDEYSLVGQYVQDFNDSVQTADVAVGRGRRRSTTLAASATHSFDARLSAGLSTSYDRTTFAQVGADAYDNAAVNGTVSYRLSETDSISLQGGHARFRSDLGHSLSRTDSLGVGFSRLLSERATASINVGTYRTDSSVDALAVACPLAVELCSGGIVAPVLILLRRETTAQGLQYSASYRFQFDERSSLSLSAARQQAPSGSGTVVRSDTLNATAARAFSETLSGLLVFSRSRSAQEAIGGSIGQRSLTAGLTKQLSADLSVAATYQRVDSTAGSTRAHANSVGVSFNVEWPRRLEANH